MCMAIKRTGARATKPAKPLIGYKYMKVIANDRIKSPTAGHHQWTNGVNISDRPLTRLTSREIEEQYVAHGFHFFYKIESAKEEAIGGEVIMEFIIQPEDFVTNGRVTGTEFKGFIATKCKPTGKVLLYSDFETFAEVQIDKSVRELTIKRG